MSKLEREKDEFSAELKNRSDSLTKQVENVGKLQKQVKELREKLENSEVQVDELRLINHRQSEENKALFKQVCLSVINIFQF